MKSIKVALIGYGYWGKILEHYIENDSIYRLKYIYDISESEDNLNGKRINNLELILVDEEIEIVFIATPIKTHFELVKLFVKYGKNVVCEKPLSLKKKEIEELILLEKETEKFIETNYIYLYSDGIKKMKELLKEIGEIKYIDASITQYGKFYKEDNVYSVIGCHLLSVLFDFFGNNCEIIKKDLYLNKENKVLIGELELKYSSFNARLLLSLLSFEKKRRITIYGNKGILEYDMLKKESLVLNRTEGEIISEIEKYEFNEKDNIKKMLTYVKDIFLRKKKTNILLSRDITKILEELGE